jgi:exopolyphosphatase / guanosine-5'-triphosphate,3'-diphosphate pyrophosphatase
VKIAALDAGSHSFHLIVAEVGPSGTHRIIDRSKEIVRIGEETLRTRVIPDDSFARGLAALANLRRFGDAHAPEAFVAVATEAIRAANNGAAFVKAARERAGVELRTVTADEEARLVYLGARQSLDLTGGRRVALFDLGGGSLEALVADDKRILFTRSLPVGGIRLAESWLRGEPPDARRLADMRAALRLLLAPVLAEMRSVGFDFVALVGGTSNAVRDMVTARIGSSEIRLNEIRLNDLQTFEHELAAMTTKQRAEVPGLHSKRVDTIVPGTSVLRTVIELSGRKHADLCRSTIRDGIVADYVARRASVGERFKSAC